MRLVVEPGYARRWLRRNLVRMLLAVACVAAGITIREGVAATRAERWIVGSEIIPATIFWLAGARLALGEISPRKRGARR